MDLSLSPALAPTTETGDGNSHLLPLGMLRANERALIVETGECPVRCQRLASLGLIPGTPVNMICHGRTCLLQLGYSRLSLRCDDLNEVLVERVYN